MPIVRVGDEQMLLPRQAAGSPPPWQLRRWPYLRTLRSGFIFKPTICREWWMWEEAITKAVSLLEERGSVTVDELDKHLHTECRIGRTERSLSLDIPYNDSIGKRRYHHLGIGELDTVDIFLSGRTGHSPVMIAEIDIQDDTKIFDLASYASTTSMLLEPPWFPDFAAWLVERTKGKLSDLIDPYDFSWLQDLADVRSTRLNLEFVLCLFAAEAGYGAKLLTVGGDEIMQVLDSSTARIVSISRVFVVDPYPKVPDHNEILRAKTGRQEILDNDEMLALVRDIPDSVLADADISTPYMLDDPAARRRARSLMLELSLILQKMLRMNSDLRQASRTFKQDIELDYLTIAAAKRVYSLIGELRVCLGDGPGNKFITVGERLGLPGEAVKGLVRPGGYEGWSDPLFELAMERSTHPKVASHQEKLALALQKQISELQNEIDAPSQAWLYGVLRSIRNLMFSTITYAGTRRLAHWLDVIPQVLDA